jgi:hypothetical protein
MVAELETTVPTTRTCRRLLHLNQHEDAHATFLGVVREGLELIKRREAVIHGPRRLLMPLARVVFPHQVVAA